MIPREREKEFDKFYEWLPEWYPKKDPSHSKSPRQDQLCNPQQTSQGIEQLPQHNPQQNSPDFETDDRDILLRIRRNLKKIDKDQLEDSKLNSIMFRD
jgi:hypothetical protein